MSIKELESAAQNGDVDAMISLAEQYADEESDYYDPTESARWLFEASKNGSALAELDLGIACEEGSILEQNYLEAYKHYSIAAARGNADAWALKGELYEEGKGVARKPRYALSDYKMAASKGSAYGCIKLGDVYYKYAETDLYDEDIVERDYEKAKYYYEIGAEGGYSDGYLHIGEMYIDGLLEDVNSVKKGLEYLEKAADERNEMALFRLAKLYLEGKLVEKDLGKSYQYFEDAYDEGNEDACFFLGAFYLTAQNSKEEVLKALQYFMEGTRKSKYKKRCEDLITDIINGRDGCEKICVDPEEYRSFLEDNVNDNDVCLLHVICSFYMETTDYFQGSNISDYEKAKKYAEIALTNDLDSEEEYFFNLIREKSEKAIDKNRPVIEKKESPKEEEKTESYFDRLRKNRRN